MERKHLNELPDFLTPKEVQDFMRISQQTVYNLINSSGFPVLRVGKKILVPKADYVDWLKKNTVGSEGGENDGCNA